MATGGTSDVNFEKFDFDSVATSINYIDRGAFGEVYGPFTWNSRECAFKRIWISAGRPGDDFKTKVEDKNSIWTSVTHKNLIEIYNVILRPKALYIVMEYASGGSLRRLLDDSDVTAHRQRHVSNWATQIAEGMRYLHEKNIVHRDLKSNNIMLMRPFDSVHPHKEMTLKITDFDDIKEHNHTTTMSFRGTLAYTAPEVLKTERFSKASDVWSYGVVVWEMLTGKLPHDDDVDGELMLKALTGQLTLSVPDYIPEAYRKLLCDCLHQDRSSRPSFESIIDLLKEARTVKPTLLKGPANVIITEDENAIFVATISGKPKPTVQLYKNNKLINPSEMVIYATNDHTHWFTIRNAQLNDGGIYTVKAVNEAGELAAYAKLTVIDKIRSEYKLDPVFVSMIRTKASEEENKSIHGLTILDGILFVLRSYSSEVEVYDSVEFSYKLSRRWNLKELINPQDIVSCDRNKCLYIFDYKGLLGRSNDILRVDPNGKLIKNWSTVYDWGYGLSVTDESNVILTVANEHKLNEYSSDGQLIREIDLSDAGIRHPWHAIKLTNGHFVISHGSDGDDLRRVCEVDSDGRLKKSFGGIRGSTIGQVNRPVSLSVDRNGFVMVADCNNSRVLLLNSDLEFKREILSKEKHKLRRPDKILLDESNGRLFVADNESNNQRILIFDFK